ncbi:MAG TPA: hypothetical protein VIO32_03130, partial [Candidatus Baltobacteraceae bacterium]
MSASRARKIMIAAVALSLLLHLILAGYIPWPFNRPSEQTQIVRVRQVTIARIVPHTPPPSTPAPTPLVTPAAKVKVVPPAVTARGTKGSRVAIAAVPVRSVSTTAPATAVPAPRATSTATACLFHDISPAVAATEDPASLDIPPQARASRVSGTAQIQVQI